jgi:membrane protease YdiL (CAAX protease family)
VIVLNFRCWILWTALLLPTAAALSYFYFFSDPKWMIPLYSTSKFIQFSLPLFVLFFFSKENFRWEPLGSNKFFLGNFIGILFFVILLLTYWGLKDFSFVKEAALLIFEKLSALGVHRPLQFFIFSIFISVFHAFLEEYYWRWYVYRELRRSLSALGASFFSSVAFTSHHVVVISAYIPESVWKWGIFVFPAYVFMAGFVWAFMYERTNSLALVWISHIWADIAIMGIAAMMVF